MSAARKPPGRTLADEFGDEPEQPAPAAAAGPAAFQRRSTVTARTKFAKIRPDQQAALDELARDLQDMRTVRRERITANTLIRVAIDNLLRHANYLHGDTEVELLSSLLEISGVASDSEAASEQES